MGGIFRGKIRKFKKAVENFQRKLQRKKLEKISEISKIIFKEKIIRKLETIFEEKVGRKFFEIENAVGKKI